MKRSSLVFWFLAANLGAQSLPATYQQVLAPALDPQQVAAIENVRFSRDALEFQLSDGFLALTAPVNGHVTAAVFNGHGSLTVTPPTASEAAEVRRFLGEPTVTVQFTQALFRFPDAGWLRTQLAAQARFQPNPRGAELAAVVDERAKLEERQGWGDAARILQAVFAPQPDAIGPFLADLKTDRFGWVQAVFDPQQQEEVEVHRFAQSANTGPAVFDDVWTQFEKAADRAQGIEAAHKRPEVVALDDFHLEVTIPHDLDMQERATFQIAPRAPVGRGIFLALDSNLRVTAARTAAGQPVAWLQPRDPGRMRPPEYQGDWLYLQLPAGLAAPAVVELELHGKYVIQQVGAGNYFARSMGWYPLYPFGTPFHYAHYDLVFHCDPKDSVVATGEQVADTVENKQRREEFRASVPITVAGFAFGQYREREQAVELDGRPVEVKVFTNTQPDNFFSSISAMDDLPSMDNPGPRLLPGLDNLDPLRLQPLVVQEVANSLRFFDAIFGPYPYHKLAVANIPGSYGQGWPSLLYLSSLSFLDSTQLHGLGLPADALRQLSDTFRAHETSHQWWGHKVAWASPRDQWISEGFANTSALLYESVRFGEGAARQTLEEWRRDLLQRNRYGHAPVDEGPVWLGQRLSSTLDPSAYETVVYAKGGYILYMLREMMLETGTKQPDARFIAMLRDFTQTYSGRAASTADFEAVVNKHMTPEMDLDGNHRMDWYFNEYVYGTGVPRVRFDYTLAPHAKGSLLTMRFHQEPANWKEIMPVYLHFSGKRWLRGKVALRQADETVTVQVPAAVQSVSVNDYDDMLVIVSR